MDYVQVKTDSELRCLCDHTVLENIEGGKMFLLCFRAVSVSIMGKY
jgi:hypothetical protein